MADAARSAKDAFKEIKTGANDAATATSYSMGEARHGVMLLGEEFGVHLPRGITSFIASIGPVGAAMEAAFPFLAIVVGATLLLEHLSKMREEGEKLTQSQANFGQTVSKVYEDLDKKILEAGIKADDLNNDHLSALHKQLELINHASLDELEHSFEELAKSADAVFAELKTSWYQFGIGSAGAKHALSEFKTQYDTLLARGKDKEAADLLSGTRKSAERVLQLQSQAKQAWDAMGGKSGAASDASAQYEAAKNELKKAGVGYTDREIQAQQVLVNSLAAQVHALEQVNTLKQIQRSNAKTETGNKVQTDNDAVARQNADAEKREQEYAQKQWEENYRNALARLEESEREKIEATQKGSAARLQAIDAAIKQEQAYGLQETGFYRSLLDSRARLTEQMTEEESKQKEEAGQEAAAFTEKMGQLENAAKKGQDALRDSAHRVSIANRIAEEIKYADDDFRVQLERSSREIAALDKHGKDYENKLKALQDKQLELTKQHENQVTQIKDKAEEERNARILGAETRLNDSIANGLTSVLMRHETFSKMMVGLGDQVAAGMMQNAIKSILTNDMTKESDAAAAARKAYLAGMHFPFPVNIAMGPALGALAFASVMAFEGGGMVPGVERGDVVPARLEPGEAVLPKKMTERLNSASGDDSGNRKQIHITHSPTYHVQTIDGDGIRDVLTKHSDEFHREVLNHVRKMNG